MSPRGAKRGMVSPVAGYKAKPLKGVSVSESEGFRRVEEWGREYGRAQGSWVIDGNTHPDYAGIILEGYEIGDPRVMDLEPSPLSGEWADGVSVAEVCEMAGVDPGDDGDVSAAYESFERGFSDGFWEVVLRDAGRVAVVEG